MRIVLIMNMSAGSLIGAPLDELSHRARAPFEAAGAEMMVLATPARDIATTIRRVAESEADCVMVAGGDGTIRTAAEAVMPLGKTLGILPMGTMNLLARDLGMPLELEAAAAALANGRPRAIDVGSVNGSLFLNCSLVGGQARMVWTRERMRGRSFVVKWPVLGWTGLRTLVSPKHFKVDVDSDLEDDEHPRRHRTPLIAVSTAPYRDGVALVPARESLDGGRLGVYIAAPGGGLIKPLWRMLRGNWRPDDDMRALTPTCLTIHHRRDRLRVSNDGEMCRLDTPLEYRLLPRALNVLAPTPDDA